MAQQNGGGNIGATEELIGAGANGEASLDGFGQATPGTPFSEHPELLVGAALLGGMLLAGLVSRLGR